MTLRRPSGRAPGLGRGPHRLDFTDPDSLPAHAERYLAWLTARAYAAGSVLLRRKDLAAFFAFCEERGITRPPDLSRLVIELYQKKVAAIRKKDGSPLSWHTQGQRLLSIAMFCKWLARERLVLYNPAAELELPRRGLRLPRVVLSAEEVEHILAVPDTTTPLGLRDRAILETFYSTGIRRAELANLRVPDLDAKRGIVAVRQGKGRKDRFVPIGERALAWIERYLEEVRPRLVGVVDPGALFLGIEGEPLTPDSVGDLTRDIIDEADIGKRGACHLFRHTMATLMLEGGADVRVIQEILGHAKLDTTQIYTHVSIHTLKAVHEATHPGAKLRRHQRSDELDTVDAPEPDPAA
jgi:integrase/recombinase XerD